MASIQKLDEKLKSIEEAVDDLKIQIGFLKRQYKAWSASWVNYNEFLENGWIF